MHTHTHIQNKMYFWNIILIFPRKQLLIVSKKCQDISEDTQEKATFIKHSPYWDTKALLMTFVFMEKLRKLSNNYHQILLSYKFSVIIQTNYYPNSFFLCSHEGTCMDYQICTLQRRGLGIISNAEAQDTLGSNSHHPMAARLRDTF